MYVHTLVDDELGSGKLVSEVEGLRTWKADFGWHFAKSAQE